MVSRLDPYFGGDNSEHHLRAAVRAMNQGKFQEAQDLATKAIKQGGDSADAYAMRGLAAAQHGKLQNAIRDYVKACALDPANARQRANLAQLRLTDGDVPGALQDADRAVELGPSEAVAYRARAMVRRAADNREGSEDDAHRARLLDATTDEERSRLEQLYRITTLSRKGHKHLDTDQLDDAQQVFSEILELDPSNLEALMNLAEICMRNKDFEFAAACYQKSFSLVAPDVHDLRGCLVATRPDIGDHIVGCFPLNSEDDAGQLLFSAQQLYEHWPRRPNRPVDLYCFKFQGEQLKALPLTSSKPYVSMSAIKKSP